MTEVNDLYHIHGDTYGLWRFNRCVDWIANFPSEIIPNAKLLANTLNWDKDDLVWYTYLYACTYSYPTAALLVENIDFRMITEEQFDKFYTEHKGDLIFQSDRRWVGFNNALKRMCFEFLTKSNRHPYAYVQQFLKSTSWDSYISLYKEMAKFYYFSRFGVGLFLYNLSPMIDVPLDAKWFDWRRGSTCTACVFLLLYQDSYSKQLDDCSSFIPPSVLDDKGIAVCDAIGESLVSRLKALGQKADLLRVSSDMCSFLKLITKHNRHALYYVDRQLDELYKLIPRWEGHEQESFILNAVLENRKKVLPEKYLGELNGYTKPQTWKNDMFLKTGTFETIPGSNVVFK